MDGILSQEEINALLNGISPEDKNNTSNTEKTLSEEEKDVIGEVSNIGMGASSTTLSSLLDKRVVITAPQVSYSTWDELSNEHDRPCVFIQIYYKEGLEGSNVLLIKDLDAKYITNLMMGGDGSNLDEELTDLHLSAISEAMNQMMGTAATSLSTFLETRVDITPPTAVLIDLNDNVNELDVESFLKERFVKVAFKMEIGDQVNTEIMQLYPFEFAKSLYNKFIKVEENATILANSKNTKIETETKNLSPGENKQGTQVGESVSNQTSYAEDVRVQPASFQPFVSTPNKENHPENINMIMDVPLDVRVELGRTNKSIKEILNFAPGTIIELDKLSGEPVDVLVNEKLVAKGEVVVIDESFGIRIVEILSN